MRFLLIFSFLAIGFAGTAQADAIDYLFTPEHPNFEKPHLEDGKTPHNVQWQNGLYVDQDWKPEYWVNAKGSAEAVLDGFYRTGVLVKEDMDDEDDPCFTVGYTYLELSGLEKRRVAEFMDYAFNVTKNNPDQMVKIYYDKTLSFFDLLGDPIAIYTTAGLQLQ